MSQCVPRWDVEDNPTSPRVHTRAQSRSDSLNIDVPTLDYEVAELTWENGQLAMHGFGLPRVHNNKTTATSAPKYVWDKPPQGGGGDGGGGTLESIVNQATSNSNHHDATIALGGAGCGGSTGDELLHWFAVPSTTTGSAATMEMAVATAAAAAALVPCTNNTPRTTTTTTTGTKDGKRPSMHAGSLQEPLVPRGGCSSTHVESCSAVPDVSMSHGGGGANVLREWSSWTDHSVSNSGTWGRESRQVTLDTCERDFGTVGLTSTTMGSPENSGSTRQGAKTADEHDSVFMGRTQLEGGDEGEKKKGKCSISTKRSRAAAIHNQSERKRRDRINQRMKTLQKLIPNSSKTDKASMLDEVIEYLKQLQAQVQMMSRMNMSTMMLPMAMQQQLQMSMMAPMGMGIGMARMGMAGMGVMDMNSMGHASNIPGIPPVLHPGPFIASWDGNSDRFSNPLHAIPDPLSAFVACQQSMPMTMETYTRLASLYQQFQPPPGPDSKK